MEGVASHQSLLSIARTITEGEIMKSKVRTTAFPLTIAIAMLSLFNSQADEDLRT